MHLIGLKVDHQAGISEFDGVVFEKLNLKNNYFGTSFAAKGKTGLVAASVTLRAFGNRAAAGPMVLPHAMAAIRI